MSWDPLTTVEIDLNQPRDEFTESSLSSTKPISKTHDTSSGLNIQGLDQSNSPSRRGKVRFICIEQPSQNEAHDSNLQKVENLLPESRPVMMSHHPSLSLDTLKVERDEIQNPFDDPKMNLALRSLQPSPTINSHVEEQNKNSEALMKKENRSSETIRPDLSPAIGDDTHRKPQKFLLIPQRVSFEDTGDEWQPLHQINTARTEDTAVVGTETDENYEEGNNDLATAGTNLVKGPRKNSETPWSSNSFSNCRGIGPDNWRDSSTVTPGFNSGQITPFGDKYVEDFIPNSTKYHDGLLTSLLKHSTATLIDQSNAFESSCHTSNPNASRIINNKHYQSTLPSPGDLRSDKGSLSHLGAPKTHRKLSKESRSGTGKRGNNSFLDSAKNKITGRARLEDEIRITIHVAEIINRQNYLLKLCHALMSFGAPTHRLEEYMRMSARVLEIQGSFLYLPGCMIISFDDVATHTTEVRLVKTTQGVNLGLLKDIHEIYKEVVHDIIGVEEATQRLDRLSAASPKHNNWVLVIVYGLASASVAPFAFEGRYIDMPICFILGCILGFLQLIIAPRSDLYSNVFEITAAVLTSFLARAFGSIQNGNLFCFSAMAQSSIALILPGYMVLCGSLELQSRSIIAGSVRMVYAIIYSLFLGFGITIGTAFYGLLDVGATSATTCAKPAMSDYEKWPWVPVFTLCLSIINQAKWKQTPVMLLIGFAGYIVNFFSAKRFPSSAQISNALGAFAVGILGNLYSRTRHGVAAAALLPALFVQVPSGLAASGSLLSGLSTADKITNTPSDFNGTAINGTSSVAVHSADDLNTIVFNVGYSMIQIAIGITVGLFMSAILVYPLGKRRSGLFSF